MTATLVLLRHGQSEWNKKNLFTGWVDVPLSEEGKEEAKRAQILLEKYDFDVVFTSILQRAEATARIVLDGHNPKQWYKSPDLNERRYGELEGKDKNEMRAIHGEKQVENWRRGFRIRPPGGESLEDTCERVLPYFKTMILPLITEGKTILICAHGNSLRALVKYLEDVSDDDITHVEIPTAEPIVYRVNDQGKVIEKKVLRSATTTKHV